MPSVAVVIPSYNCAHYLAEAVDSVLAQTYRDFEVIVIDDGSTDNTAEVAARFGSRIRCIHQENRGLPAARNRGIRESQSPYIAFLDADDAWFPEKLAEQIPAFSADPEVGLVYSDLQVLYDDGQLAPSFLGTRPLAASGYVFDRILRSGFIIPSSVVVRRAAIDNVGLFDESMRSHEDVELWSRICHRWKVQLVSKPLVTRRQRVGSLTGNEDMRSLYGLKFYQKVLQIPGLEPEHQRFVRYCLAACCQDRGRFCLSEGRIAECRETLLESLKYNWRNMRAILGLVLSYLPRGVYLRMRTLRASMRS